MLFGTQQVLPDGHLSIGGCDAVDLAREFGTPLYVIDEEQVRQQMRDYRRAFETRYPQNAIAYAGKAFLCTAMAKIVDQEGLHLDVASAGELYTALQAGFPANRIQVHGNNKTPQEVSMSLEAGVGRIIVDNLPELDLIVSLAREKGTTADVVIRTAPGIDPHTHRRIRTGQEDTKFGMNIKDGSALKAIARAMEAPEINFTGIHCHVGSQLMNATSHIEAIDVMCAFMREIQDTHNTPVEEVNLGGGLGIRYLSEHNPDSYEKFAESLVAALEDSLSKYGLQKPILGQEPGRSLIGTAGTTIYTVGPIKSVPTTEEPGTRNYVNIDGGMSDNPRPQLYDAVYEALLANKANQPRDYRARIAGKHCETDILIQDTHIQIPEQGDILAVQGTGAYNFAMASNYNRYPRPAVVLVNQGQADIIVEREDLEDIVRKDRVPERLQKLTPIAT